MTYTAFGRSLSPLPPVLWNETEKLKPLANREHRRTMQTMPMKNPSRVDRSLVAAGFDLTLFKCQAEKELALRELDRLAETKLVKRFGVSPAWIIGTSGPFIGHDGVTKLTHAFEIGSRLGKDVDNWPKHFTSVEVIRMIPGLHN